MQKKQKKISNINIIGSLLSAIAAGTIVFIAMNSQLKQCINQVKQKQSEKPVVTEEKTNITPHTILPALQPKNVEISNKTECYHILNATRPDRCLRLHYQTLNTSLEWLDALLLNNQTIEQIQNHLQRELDHKHSKNIHYIAQQQHIDASTITVKKQAINNIENTPVAENNHSVIFINQKGKIAQFQIHDSEFTFDMANHLFTTKYRIFDLQRQAEISLNDIIIPSQREILAKILLQRLKENNNLSDEYLKENCKNQNEQCLYNEILNTQFYFDKDSIVFSYDPYQLAHYSAGVIELKPEYWELQGIIKDEYLPYR